MNSASNRSKTILVCATTLNGWIGRDGQNQPDWTSREDMDHFSSFTRRIGAVVMGHRTFRTLPRPLPNRLNVVMTRNPELEAHSSDEVWYCSSSPIRLLETLKKRGFPEVCVIGGEAINTLFWNERLIDEMVVTIEPVLFSGQVALVGSKAIERRLSLLTHRALPSGALILHYRVLDWSS